MGNTRFNKFTQFNTIAVSGTTAYHSAVTDINQQHNIGLDITYVGTMAGTLIVECCNDNTNFKPLTVSPTITQPSGSSVGVLVSLNQIPFQYLRVTYTNATGSGTLKCIMTSKDLS